MKICIYHANCADGFGAAWVVRKALGEIEFHAAKYNDPPPDVTGKDVIIVDFSYKRHVLLAMAEQANNILILDHHKTAAKELIDLPWNVFAQFDMNHSGAMLAWEHFFPGQTPPPLLSHIEDRDLWRFDLRDTKHILSAVFSYRYDFQIWDQIMKLPLATLAMDGDAIDRKFHKDLFELIELTAREMVVGGYRVPVANLPHTMSSEAGSHMANGHPFAACYYDTPAGRVFSLRSTSDGVDVSEVAAQYGGGGHRNAAGFLVRFEQARAFEIGETS